MSLIHRYFAIISFKGTNFFGWQRQPNNISVQEELNKCLSLMLKENIDCTGAGRTDTGVHARYFVLHFDSANAELSGNIDFIYKLNSFLGDDIFILKIIQMPDKSHARFDAVSRTYEYLISLKKNPFLQGMVWFRYGDLNIELMNRASEMLLNVSDFASFSKTHSGSKTNICKVSYAKWVQEGDLLKFEITADRFLRNMVRAIVGTMVEIGSERMSLEEFKNVIESKDRCMAGQSVPAEGLYLIDIKYMFNL